MVAPIRVRQAAFDMGQKSILLAFVEAVDFIDKKDGVDIIFSILFGCFNNLSDLLHTGKDRGKENEIGIYRLCQDRGQGRFS